MLSTMSFEMALGVVAAAGAALCFDGAVVLQAQDARRVHRSHGLRLSLLRRLVTQRRWLSGTALAVLGVPLQLGAFALAPVTVVQPTLAVGMLFLLAAGARLLDEHIGVREWSAAAAIVAGVVALATGGPSGTNDVPSVAAAAVPVAVLAAVVASAFVLGNRRSTAWTLIAAAGCAFALSALCGKLLVTQIAAGHAAAAAGLFAAAAASSGVGLLVDTTALQRFPATRVAPPMFVIETAIPVALAPWLFAEGWPGTVAGDAILAAGLALVLAGGGVLAASRPVSGLEDAGGTLHQGEHGVGGAGPVPVGEVGPPR
jgi:drug/metabolite transporter (DMT)-like permease